MDSARTRFGGWCARVPIESFSTPSWPTGGIVLQNVTHGSYHMAKDIRVVGIWVFGDDDVAEPLMLGPDDFVLEAFRLVQNDGSETPLMAGPMPGTTIEAYNSTIVGFVYARYTLKNYENRKNKGQGALFGPGDRGLIIEQKFLFTGYGVNPSHEPGAILHAARLFPITSFFTQNPKVRSLRVDYRFEMGLDLCLDPTLVEHLCAAAAAGGVTGLDGLCDHPCVAGVFRDLEDLPMSPSALMGDLDALFEAYEKPVPFELCSYGLRDGLPGRWVSVDDRRDLETNTWDNIHVWGSATLNGTLLMQSPSTPGAFHAFHLHWRWPRAVQHPTEAEEIARRVGPTALALALPPWIAPEIRDRLLTLAMGDFGASQHQGLDIGDDRYGGPLLDPRLPNQTIRFALTRPLPGPPKVLSEETFEELFYSAGTRQHPRDIDRGGDLTLWISFEAAAPSIPTLELGGFQPVGEGAGFGGSFFVTGIYFAHDTELSRNPAAETQRRDGQNPRSAKDWYRTPTGPG